MASGVEELLDILYEMVDEAKGVPLSAEKCMIDRDRALDLLDDVRAQFPMELKEAKKLLNRRSEYLASAQREAESIKKRAEEEARELVSQNQVVSQARSKGGDLVRAAEEQSRELRRAANEYCEDVLRRAEEAMAEAYAEVKQKRARFRAVAGQNAAPGARKHYDAEADQ